jgi:hypothetical protein
MRTHLLVHSGLVLLVGSLSAAPVHFKLWGQVRDEARQGVPFALVLAGRDSCRADASGNYAFAALPPGPCALRISAPGHESARDFVYLRKEAFLPLILRKPRQLMRDFASVSSQDASPQWQEALDVDGDHAVDLAGWKSPLGVGVATAHGLSSCDPWQDPWLAEAPFVGTNPTATTLARPFFALKGARHAWEREEIGPSQVLEAGSQGLAGLKLSLAREVGPWHQLEIGGALGRRQLPLAGEDATSSRYNWQLRHHWLPAKALQLNQAISGGREELKALSSRAPQVWFPLASIEFLDHCRLTQQSLAWQGLAIWTPGASLRTEVQGWARQRTMESEGLELDRVADRLPSGARPSSQRHNFQTWRADERMAWGVRGALEQVHDRGLLQLGVELESQRRDSRATLGPDSLVGVAEASWFSLQEEQRHFAATLRDMWRMGEHLHLEAALDLRYFYYDLRRRERYGWPDLAFNSDLLALNPRVAVGNGHGWEVSASRRQWQEDPSRWWAPGRSPEAAGDKALVEVADLTGELEALLPSPKEDEVRLHLASAPTAEGLAWSGDLWGRQWRNLALPWWTKKDRSFLPDRPVQALDAQEAGLDLRLAYSRPSWRLTLDATATRGWLTGWLWKWQADSSLWSRQDISLISLPGTPAWQGQMKASHAGIFLGGWRLAPSCVLQLHGVRPNSWAPGMVAEDPANWGWRAELMLAPRVASAFQARLWMREGWAAHQSQGHHLLWRADLSQGEDLKLPAPPRQVGITLNWSPRHGH